MPPPAQTTHLPRAKFREPGLVLAAFALIVLAQWPLLSNPGYFSHDELEWASAAFPAAGHPLPWMGWLDLRPFQYRPLTFNLWLWISHHLFDRPQAFHAVVVVWGSINGLALLGLARRLGAPRYAALGALLVFALGPYATYVHGWVATLGDLIWVSCGLAIAWACISLRTPAVVALIAAGFTAIGLLGKEAALSIPALLLIAAVLDRKQRAWRWALLGAGLVATTYMALRLGVLANPGESTPTYRWSVGNIPQRWLEYQVFLTQLPKFEPHTALRDGLAGKRVIVPMLFWLLTLVAIAQAGWRWALGFIAGGIAALGPVLVLPASASQYGYGLAAVYAGIVACAWPRLPRWGRVTVTLVAFLVLWHGVNVMRQMRHVGEVQAVFSPALANVVADNPQSTIRLSPAPETDAWIFDRLTHEIPTYHGVAIGDRVKLVAPGSEADYVILEDGRLQAAR